MKKSALFLIISIITIIFLFSTAALCNMCGLSLVSDAEKASSRDNDSEGSSGSGKSGDSKTKSSSSSESQDSKSADDGKSSGDTKKDKSSQASIKIKDILIGDLINNNVSPVKDLLANNSYTCQPVFETAPDDTEKYNWSVSGGICDNHTMLMQWNTPSDEGTYTVKLNVTKADGSTGSKSKDVYINPSAILGEPPQPPFIADIRIYDTPGNNHGGHYFAGFLYQVVPLVDGANELIDSIDLSATAGNTRVDVGDYTLFWEAPGNPQKVTITVMIYDSSGNLWDSKSIQVEVELPPGG